MRGVGSGASAEDVEGFVRTTFVLPAEDRETGIRVGHELDWEYLRRWAAEFALIPGRESLPATVEELRREVGDP